MKKPDRRIKYTKLVLKETLIMLLKTKPINKITIKELCEKADINRSTFYAHYQDQYDLLKTIEKEFFREIKNYLKKYHLNNSKSELTEMLEYILIFIKENQDLSNILLSHPNFSNLQKKIILLTQEQTINEWHEQLKDQKKATYFLIFSVNGSIGVLQEWLKNNMQESPKEIAEIITAYIFAFKNKTIWFLISFFNQLT